MIFYLKLRMLKNLSIKQINFMISFENKIYRVNNGFYHVKLGKKFWNLLLPKTKVPRNNCTSLT